MLTAFNCGQLYYNTSIGMWNMKCKNAYHVKNNVTIATVFEFARYLIANICLLLTIYPLSDLIWKHPGFMKSALVENLCLTFL